MPRNVWRASDLAPNVILELITRQLTLPVRQLSPPFEPGREWSQTTAPGRGRDDEPVAEPSSTTGWLRRPQGGPEQSDEHIDSALSSSIPGFDRSEVRNLLADSVQSIDNLHLVSVSIHDGPLPVLPIARA